METGVVRGWFDRRDDTEVVKVGFEVREAPVKELTNADVFIFLVVFVKKDVSTG